jgi:hypothetical protein
MKEVQRYGMYTALQHSWSQPISKAPAPQHGGSGSFPIASDELLSFKVEEAIRVKKMISLCSWMTG